MKKINKPVSSVFLFLRSLSFSLGMIVSAVIWAPVVMLAAPLAYERRYRLAQQWARFIIGWAEKTCGIGHRINGLERLPSGPAIILAKHQSTWETLFLFGLLPPQAWVVKRELLRIPFFGWALALLDPIAIERKASSRAFKQVMKQGKEHLHKGHWVVIFPEGTRVAPGARVRYGQAGAKLAVDTGYPVVPIAHNAGEFWPRRGFLKHPGIIEVVIGPVMESRNRSAQQLTALVEDWIETTMQTIGITPSRSTSETIR